MDITDVLVCRHIIPRIHQLLIFLQFRFIRFNQFLKRRLGVTELVAICQNISFGFPVQFF